MDWLMHHGVKGQKWGVHRYQNPDGTLTEAGKQRYSKNKNSEGILTQKEAKYVWKQVNKARKKEAKEDAKDLKWAKANFMGFYNDAVSMVDPIDYLRTRYSGQDLDTTNKRLADLLNRSLKMNVPEMYRISPSSKYVFEFIGAKGQYGVSGILEPVDSSRENKVRTAHE